MEGYCLMTAVAALNMRHRVRGFFDRPHDRYARMGANYTGHGHRMA